MKKTVFLSCLMLLDVMFSAGASVNRVVLEEQTQFEMQSDFDIGLQITVTDETFLVIQLHELALDLPPPGFMVVAESTIINLLSHWESSKQYLLKQAIRDAMQRNLAQSFKKARDGLRSQDLSKVSAEANFNSTTVSVRRARDGLIYC